MKSYFFLFLDISQFALFYHPILYLSTLRIEVYAYFYYGFSTKCKSLCIVFEIDLLHGGLCILVEFQLYYI